jgi:succinate dehydrogenase / fumarate reductase cytochrome b subunit
MTRIGNALASSVGKKVVLGATGLLLVLFLVEHLHGNLKLYEDREGQAFGEYVSFLQGFGPLLLLAELGLAALFLAHVYLALRLTLENLQARRTRYVIRNNRGASTLASLSMFYSGALLLGYLLKHLYDFRFDRRFFAEPAATVARTLSQPGHALVYLAAAALLGLHLSHGFRSAFQSLGISHPRWNVWLERLGLLLALVFALGFGSFPIYYLFFWSDGGGP